VSEEIKAMIRHLEENKRDFRLCSSVRLIEHA
jgi:ribosomal protein S15P/S13E